MAILFFIKKFTLNSDNYTIYIIMLFNVNFFNYV